MTQDVTAVRPTESLADVQLLWGRASQRFLPVLEDGRPVGMLSRADALVALKDVGLDGPVPLVRDVMKPVAAGVRPGTPLRHAANLMLQHEVRSLAVVDEAGRLVGLLTDDELLRFALDLVVDLDRLSDGLRRDSTREESQYA